MSSLSNLALSINQHGPKRLPKAFARQLYKHLRDSEGFVAQGLSLYQEGDKLAGGSDYEFQFTPLGQYVRVEFFYVSWIPDEEEAEEEFEDLDDEAHSAAFGEIPIEIDVLAMHVLAYPN